MVLNLLLACLEAEICVGERNEHGSLCTGYIVHSQGYFSIVPKGQVKKLRKFPQFRGEGGEHPVFLIFS